MKNNRFVIITPFYNPGIFLERCVSSLISQKYNNFKVVFIDDASTDGSWNKLPQGMDNVVCIRNEKNLTALENIHNAVLNHCDPEDIVVLVDGDDSLTSRNVLTYLNDFYNDPKNNDPWIVYGESQWSDGRPSCSYPYDENRFKNLRTTQFLVSHIRTFKAGLYHKIKEQDPLFSCMKDSVGEFYKMTYDVAIMFPIMEMAGFDKVKYNDKVLYLYNRDNPISDDKKNQTLQTSIHIEIANKPKFEKINSYI